MKPNPIDSWVKSLDADAIGNRLEQIETEMDALKEERKWLLEALEFKNRWTHSERSQESSRIVRAVPEAHFPLDGGPPVRGKTDAVLRVLGSEPDREWMSIEIGEQLIMRGWMEDSESDYASLLSTLSRLYSEGRIHRPHRGHYRLSPPIEEASS